MATPGSAQVPEDFRYTPALERLRQITEKLQEADLPFEDRVALFREGQGLLAACQLYLDRVELEFLPVDVLPEA